MAKADRAFANMLKLAINEAHSEHGTRLRALADALVTKGLTGDVAALKEIADRVDGKVAQALIGGEDDDPPITFAGAVTLSATGALIAGIAGSNSGPAPSEPRQD